MNREAEKYRLAAEAALKHALNAKDKAKTASWLKHYKEWTRLAEEAERSE